MSARRVLTIVLGFVFILVLAACVASKLTSSKLGSSIDAWDSEKNGQSSGVVPPAMHAAVPGMQALPTSAAPAQAQALSPDGASGEGAAAAGEPPLVIKQAQIRLQVKDTDQAIDRMTQVVSDTGGYIVSNRVWYEQTGGESYKFATYTIAVPVDGFEVALRRLRTLAIKVVDESASGQDVSEEYVDLESRLGNLQATRDRIRGFLDQAQTVEESLRINNELATIEEQIEQVEGRMRWLSSRAAYSTITVQLDPDLPSPTPTPTPTPTPDPIPYLWDPGRTFENASGMAIKAGQFVVDAFIYLVVWIPFAIPVAAVWLVYKIVTGKRKNLQA
jgi:hypothetical protein